MYIRLPQVHISDCWRQSFKCQRNAHVCMYLVYIYIYIYICMFDSFVYIYLFKYWRVCISDMDAETFSLLMLKKPHNLQHMTIYSFRESIPQATSALIPCLY